MSHPRWPFGSLSLAGFESSWFIKEDGHRVHLLAATQQDVQAPDADAEAGPRQGPGARRP